MKRSIAYRWADLLESGEIKQTTGKLRVGNKMCCLGVLCNIHAQEHPEIAATQKKKNVYLGNETELPDAVRDFAGMYSDEGYFKNGFRLPEEGYFARSLIELNDDHNMSFPEIAKIIRKHWKEL